MGLEKRKSFVAYKLSLIHIYQILSGHNYSRAVRAHSLVQLALSKIILKDLKNNEEIAEFEKSFKDFTIFDIFNFTVIESNETFIKLVDFFEKNYLSPKKMVTLVTVSYTHLDVYKRQLLHAVTSQHDCNSFEIVVRARI